MTRRSADVKTDEEKSLALWERWRRSRRRGLAYLPQSRYAVMIAYGEFRVMIGYAKL